MQDITRDLSIDNQETLSGIFGKYDENIKKIEYELGVEILYRDGELRISGPARQTEEALKVVEDLRRMVESGREVPPDTTAYLISQLEKEQAQSFSAATEDVVCYTMKGRPIRPKTFGQKKYIEAIRRNDIVFGIGPAGTGKTYLAMAMAITAFKNEEVDKLILTRPAVEAGEKLGFLPGDLQEKVDPYLRPLYDALYEIMGADAFARNLEKGLIEVAPLAYMRGRTLENAFIILDEAQNTTPEQMKMFLTRFGQGSKIIVTGDITQIDLPYGKKSGLIEGKRILTGIDGIRFMDFKAEDVVRHKLVQRIIEAYDKDLSEQNRHD